jgi:epoxyqueuosine reductase
MLSVDLIRERALELGFDLIGFAPAGETAQAQRFVDWLAAGHHGEMGYLARADAVQKRLDPALILKGVRTVIMVGVSYETLAVPMDVLHDPARGRIARYAWGADYHDVLTPVLREFGEWVARESRAYVDTGPVLERAWAERCGLGFIGKNTCLINRERGSYLFLGAVLVANEIYDLRCTTDDSGQSQIVNSRDPRTDPRTEDRDRGRKSKMACGACTRCLSACPTYAFPAPGVLDARRCISYLTIELKGSIPESLRPLMGNWIFGCDVCQDVCPYVRRFSHPTRSTLGRSFYPLNVERAAPKLIEMLEMDDTMFNATFKGSPVKRAKRRGLVRNACVAAGNWGSDVVVPALRRLLDDQEPLVREHAAWAIRRLSS